MARFGDDSTLTAKVLSLPTRQGILKLLLISGPKTVKEIADHFSIHPNVARSHLDQMVEAGFLVTETQRRNKGRPAKVYFTWEGEAASLAEAGLEVAEQATRTSSEVDVELRVLERMLADAGAQLARIRELVEQVADGKGGTDD